MTSHIRDTQFGKLIRFLSSKKYLQYPDETDSSLWQSFVQSEEEENRGSKPRAEDEHDKERGIPDASNTTPDRSEDIGGIHVVVWYGPKDAEVADTHFLRAD
jgi:DHA1 family multidrug resistance protein-like MFS transporter